MQNLKQQGQALYQTANRASRGWLEMLRGAVHSFAIARGAQAAASIAFYAFFSLFPLLLVLVALGSFFLERRQVYEQLTWFTSHWLPVSQQLVNENLQRILDKRGAVGLLGIISLLWAASGVFNSLAYNINLAWPQSKRRNVLQNRLIALSMVLALAGLLLLSLFSSPVLSLLSQLQVPLAGNVAIYNTWLWDALSNLAPLSFGFLLLLSLYRWIPKAHVGWKANLISALIATLGWNLATDAFLWYLSSGLGQYELVYGSLGTIVALLLLIYLLSWVTLFGAHLCAAVNSNKA